jgi:hypothetical protein
MAAVGYGSTAMSQIIGLSPGNYNTTSAAAPHDILVALLRFLAHALGYWGRKKFRKFSP